MKKVIYDPYTKEAIKFFERGETEKLKIHLFGENAKYIHMEKHELKNRNDLMDFIGLADIITSTCEGLNENEKMEIILQLENYKIE